MSARRQKPSLIASLCFWIALDSRASRAALMVSELFRDVTNESEISGGGIGRRRGGRRVLAQPFHFVFPYAWREEGRLNLAAGVVIHRQDHFFSAPNVQAIGQARGR